MTIRLVSLVIQVGAVVDDGETLRPIAVDPIHLAAADWQTFDPDRLVKQLNEQIKDGA